MNQDISTVSVRIRIRQGWINAYLTRQAVTVPLRDGYALHRLHIAIDPETMQLTGELVDYPGSFVEAATAVRWDSAAQRLYFDNLNVQTRTKNIKIKSAGWFAGKFMQDKIDRQVEEAVNGLFRQHLDKLLESPLRIPLPGNGVAEGTVTHLRIDSLMPEAGAITIMASLEGRWSVELSADDEGPDASG